MKEKIIAKNVVVVVVVVVLIEKLQHVACHRNNVEEDWGLHLHCLSLLLLMMMMTMTSIDLQHLDVIHRMDISIED